MFVAYTKHKLFQGKSSEPPTKRKELTKSALPEEPVTSALKNVPLPKTAVETAQTAKKRKVETPLSGSKRFKAALRPVQPTVSFKDIGGSEKVLDEVTQLLVHLRHPEVKKTTKQIFCILCKFRVVQSNNLFTVR